MCNLVKYKLQSLTLFFWQKQHFGSYILESQSIWSLHSCNSQVSPCYFQLIVNLVPTINSLMENAYVANGVLCWHTSGKIYIYI